MCRSNAGPTPCTHAGAHSCCASRSAAALVIGLLSWIYLSTHIILLAAEANVVASRKLWPRSFSLVIEQPPTEADKRALTQRGKVEERRQDETVDIDFPASAQTDANRTDSGS